MLESLLILILVLALIVWLIGLIPMNAQAKQFVYVAVAILGIIYLLKYI